MEKKYPIPQEIVAARNDAGLTQTEAGRLVHTTCRTWQQWEAGDRKMHPAFWELFSLKTKKMVDTTRNARIINS